MNIVEIVAALRAFPVPTLSEAAPAACDLPPEIHQLVPNTPMVGTALPFAARPATILR